jgi:glycosyltransferase involved in cell wall biosynthesis
MKVLFLNSKGIHAVKTGDGTQASSTIEALRNLDVEVEQIFIQSGPRFFDRHGENVSLVAFKDACERVDLVHVLPGNVPFCKQVASVLEKVPVAFSPIYWNDLTRSLIAFRNHCGIQSKLCESLRYMHYGRRSVMDVERTVNLVLPNSYAEARNVRKHFRLQKNVIIHPVPNAIKVPSFDIRTLEKPQQLPFDEYIVVPGVFAPRKNQLGLIRALKGSNLPIVFMGGAYNKFQSYYDLCRSSATPQMFFLDYINNNTEMYWAVLRHARCACLPSDCETPGIALLEAAYAGARPVVTHNGGTFEYYGFAAEYLNPLKNQEITKALSKAWQRGRLSTEEAHSFSRFSWNYCAKLTLEGYNLLLSSFNYKRA